jgi:integrase
LVSVDNRAAKDLIAKMKSERRKDGQRRFSDKTIVSYFRVVRKVVASALDEELNPIHLRKWNLAAIGLPRVNPRKQRRPTLTAKAVTTLLSKAKGNYQVLYFFCLITGMRVSEALAIEIDKHMEADCSIVHVWQQREKSANRVKENLKTESGYRDVDIHPTAAAVLRGFIGNRRTGFLFRSENQTMFDPRNVARDSLDRILEEMGQKQAGAGFNIFRRFRESVLQLSDVRQILIDYWMGHSNSSMADRYGKQVVENIEFRQQQVEKVGLGFELPPGFGLQSPFGLQIVEDVEAA